MLRVHPGQPFSSCHIDIWQVPRKHLCSASEALKDAAVIYALAESRDSDGQTVRVESTFVSRISSRCVGRHNVPGQLRCASCNGLNLQVEPPFFPVQCLTCSCHVVCDCRHKMSSSAL